VVQHRPRTSGGGDALAAVLDRKIGLPVHIAKSGVSAQPPGVTVIPGAATATNAPAGCWMLTVEACGRWPGDAVLASSAADVPTIVVVLTGYLADGRRMSRGHTPRRASVGARSRNRTCDEHAIECHRHRLRRFRAPARTLLGRAGGADHRPRRSPIYWPFRCGPPGLLSASAGDRT
jgi:hypothetical protein